LISSATPAAPTPAAKATRYTSIDLIRCFCIVSMVAGHVAGGAAFTRAVHIVPNFDGASGFVLLSGLVLGIVQRRRLAAGGLRAAQGKVLRRIGMIYVAQVALSLAALIAGAVATQPSRNHLFAPDGLLPALGGIVAMISAPPAGSVLRLYVAMMLLGLGMFWLLARGRWAAALAIGVAVYVLGHVAPGWTSFRAATGEPGANWATWQLLFTSALVVGWYWESLRIGARLLEHRWATVIVALAFIAASALVHRHLPLLYGKSNMGLGRQLVAYAFVAGAFVVVTNLQRLIPERVLRPFVLVGQRSLDAYIIQALIVMIVPSFLAYSRRGLFAQSLILVTLAACYAWCLYRNRTAAPRRPSPTRLLEPAP
jgi:hypothetical protein